MRGRRFLHPKLGFTFTAPDGFVLENTPQAVFGVKDGGEQALRLDVVRIPADQKLTDYLAVRLDREYRRRPRSRKSPINGFHGATATANGEPWGFRLYAIRFGSEVYRFIFAAKTKTPELDRHFRDSVAELPPHERRREPRRAAAAAEDRDRDARATRSSGWPRAWRSPTGRSSASAC